MANIAAISVHNCHPFIYNRNQSIIVYSIDPYQTESSQIEPNLNRIDYLKPSQVKLS